VTTDHHHRRQAVDQEADVAGELPTSNQVYRFSLKPARRPSTSWYST
jgi:hypothetical protein